MNLSRNLHEARKAYEKRDPQASTDAHKDRAEEGHQQEKGHYVKSAVYGGLDGIITTFAVVAGVAGASLSTGVVLILGFANLIADGLSMAIGDYLSTKSEREYHEAERRRELWEIENYPEGEKREMVELYTNKGMPAEDAKQVVELISKNQETWVDIMMIEELGIMASDESPVKHALVTFFSFALFGVVPLLAYVAVELMPFLRVNTFAVASFSTGVTLFVLGALKVQVTGRNWVRSGAEMFVVGGIAATAAYWIGVLLAGLA
jgi:VIT1/CCC1 family predicted Fe2+/Mn2+ transporter